MSTENEKQYILNISVGKREGGKVVKYAQVDEPTFRKWEQWWSSKDYASMKAEAPRVLRIQLTPEQAETLANSATGPAEILLCSLGVTTYLDDVLP